MTWVDVCKVDVLTPGRGACVLVGFREVAIFLLQDGKIFGLDNRDPYCGRGVLSRGIVGSRGERDVVFSPMYKQPFCLRTGVSLEEPQLSVEVFPVRIEDGVVQVRDLSRLFARR
jgi:NAD(P)H-dependent nitrite reductase small subunit